VLQLFAGETMKEMSAAFESRDRGSDAGAKRAERGHSKATEVPAGERRRRIIHVNTPASIGGFLSPIS